MKILEIKRGEEPELKEIGDSLEDMQEVVGGYIEVIYPFDDPVGVVVNEEGKLDGLPVSRFLYWQASEYVDAICGNFFICGLSEEDLADIPDDLVEKYTTMFMPDIVKI